MRTVLITDVRYRTAMAVIRPLQRAGYRILAVQPSAQAGSAFSGGLIGRLTQTLETEGVSSIQAQRSMGEISRFFERDARRYGG